MKYLVAGLGNIGPEYTKTRHNVGFMVLDHLVTEIGAEFKTERLGDLARARIKNKQVVFLKPNTYMNLSGKAVRYWLDKEKIPIDNLLVITDDLALKEGQLRLKGKGSDGGHNGLKSINELLQTQNYARLRFGIGSEFSKGSQVNYVLGAWTNDELEVMKTHIERAANCIRSFVLSGISHTMNEFNKKLPPKS